MKLTRKHDKVLNILIANKNENDFVYIPDLPPKDLEYIRNHGDILRDLANRKFITRDPSEPFGDIYITIDGLVRPEYKLEEDIDFLLYSIFVPIIVSVAATWVTYLILR